jgi:arginyl-tRNA synthetase
MNDKQLVSQALAAVLGDALSNEAISNLLETPKKSEMGDLAFPAFSLAKSLRKAPNMIAADIAEKISSEGFEKIVATGPYVNFFLDKSATATAVLSEIFIRRHSLCDPRPNR